MTNISPPYAAQTTYLMYAHVPKNWTSIMLPRKTIHHGKKSEFQQADSECEYRLILLGDI